MNIHEMANDKYNPFIPVAEGYHLQFFDSSNSKESIKHKLLGFIILNPAGMSDTEDATCSTALPVIALSPADKEYCIFPNAEPNENYIF